MTLSTANTKRMPASGVMALTTYALVAGTTLPKHGQFASREALQAVSADLQIYSLGAIGGDGGGWRHRGAHLAFGGTGAEDSTFKLYLYASFAAGNGQRTLRPLGELTCTLSATTGASGLLLDGATYRIVDTISFSPHAWYTAARAAVGAAAAAAYSPGSDLEAVLTFGDLLGAAEIVIDPDMTGATGAVVFVEGFT